MPDALGNDVKTYGLLQHDVEEAEATYKDAVEQRDKANAQIETSESARINAVKVEETAKEAAKNSSDSLKVASVAEKQAMDAVRAAEKQLRRADENVSRGEADLKVGGSELVSASVRGTASNTLGRRRYNFKPTNPTNVSSERN